MSNRMLPPRNVPPIYRVYHAGGGVVYSSTFLRAAAVSALRYYDFERSGDLPRTAHHAA